MFDLAASTRCSTYLETMRNEVITELEAEKGAWTKASLARMVSLDSALRESMRLWGFVSRGVLKQVVAKNGVTLPDGMHVPYGVKVGVHAYPVHHDEDVYKGGYEFNALRFCSAGDERPKDDYSEKMAGNGKNKGTSLVTTSTNFMAFSHGRHAWYVHPLPSVFSFPSVQYKLTPSQPRSLFCFATAQALPRLHCPQLRHQSHSITA
jgi:hypothetical protein